MKHYLLLLCTVLFCVFSACDETGSAAVSSAVTDPSGGKPDPTATPSAPAPAAAQQVRAAHDCTIMGKPLEDSEFWLAEQELLFVIIADTAERYDKDYPESYRSFQVYDTKKCDLIGNHVMPTNKNPDYPYYLYPNTYEPTNQVVCAQGSDFVYCYNLQRQEMMLPMIPEYRSKRRAVDATSGLPQGLTVWGHYLFGYAADFGTYAFDLRNKQQVKSLLPIAEYLHKESGEMNQLFMDETKPGEFQAIYSSFDFDAGEDAFNIIPLFDQSLPVSTRLSASARNNNLLVLKYRDGSSAVGIDMEKGKRIDLPADVASKSVQEIMTWIKK